MSETEKQNETQPAEGNAAEQQAQADQGAPPKSSAPSLPEGEMSFAEMFELAEKQAKERKKQQRQSEKKGERGGDDGDRELHPGQVLEARVVGFSHDSAFLDVGGKAEGAISKIELMNEAGELTVKEGDKIEVRVIGMEGGAVKLGKVLQHQSLRNRESIRQAYDAGMPVEGKVTGLNKGGLDVEIGGLRAFCPISQIDVRFTENPQQFVGQRLHFKITEYKDGGRNIVVSRRAIALEEQKKAQEEVLSKLQVGQQVTGKVTSLKDYGAFVDLGGVEGLVHVSEISHGRVNKAQDALKIGEEVRVSILKIEEGKNGAKKISLSMKALADDPWTVAQNTLREGQKVKGKVLRIQPFGAFVEVMPGVDGLVHVSNMSDHRVTNPREVMKEGEEVEATIVSLDWSKRRIGLSLVKSKQEMASEVGVGTVHEGTVDKIESFGLFVKLPNGARGLVPSAETGTQRGTDLKKEFQIGKKVKVTVVESDPSSGKIRLSIKAVAEAEERRDYEAYMPKAAGGGGGGPSSGGGFGTLGDLLNKKSKERSKEK